MYILVMLIFSEDWSQYIQFCYAREDMQILNLNGSWYYSAFDVDKFIYISLDIQYKFTCSWFVYRYADKTHPVHRCSLRISIHENSNVFMAFATRTKHMTFCKAIKMFGWTSNNRWLIEMSQQRKKKLW